jgi:glutamate carboxypeptidase
MAWTDHETGALRVADRTAGEAARWARAQTEVFQGRLAELVAIDSAEDSPDGRALTADRLAGWAAEVGCETQIAAHPSGGYLTCTLRGAGTGRIVLLGHHDTVFPAGTAAARPMTVDGDVARGPGVADMKGGLLVALTAIEALAQGSRPFASVELHSVPDEETRVVPFATIDEFAGADAVLVLECGRENGDFVRARKTGAWLRVAVEGRSAHAGAEPALGRSAVLGLCREVLRVSALDGSRPELTVIAGTIGGGTIANVVPAHAEAIVDVRAPTSADLAWAVARIAAPDRHEGLSVTVEDLGTWPGIEPTPAGDGLLAVATELSRGQGVDAGGQTSGGMSDGCWTAARGLPTLDGLGPIGGLDHSPSEYIRLDSVPSRCAVVAGLCAVVGSGLLSPRAYQGGDDTD